MYRSKLCRDWCVAQSARNYVQELIYHSFRKNKDFVLSNEQWRWESETYTMTAASNEPQPLLVSAKTCYFCKEVIIRYITRVHESPLNVLPFLQLRRKAYCLHGLVAVSKGWTSEASQVPDLAVHLAFLLTRARLELEQDKTLCPCLRMCKQGRVSGRHAGLHQGTFSLFHYSAVLYNVKTYQNVYEIYETLNATHFNRHILQIGQYFDNRLVLFWWMKIYKKQWWHPSMTLLCR